MSHRQGWQTQSRFSGLAAAPGLSMDAPELLRTVAGRGVGESSRVYLTLIAPVLDRLDGCPWGAAAGRNAACRPATPAHALPLYTLDERRRRDESPWTLVQGVLAPLQFAVFLLSLALVLRYLATGEGYAAATGSVVLKTAALYAIMFTGSLWEREVFGRYLFARAFFWEDVFSLLVLALHTAYLVALGADLLGPRGLMVLALAAYASYVINAAQFVLKLRAARREQAAWPAGGAVAE